MKCRKGQAFLAEMVANAGNAPPDVRRHVEDCSTCQAEWKELQSTMKMLDAWETPEPGPYFDTRMAVRLREERNSLRPGWMERLRARVLFDSNLRLRPALAAGVALLLIAGAGSYEGFLAMEHAAAPQQTVSATVNDLELLDSNAQTLQQLAAFDDSQANAPRLDDGTLSN